MELLKPFKLGPIELPNRIVMAPMTRSRAGEGNVPTPLMATYYAQRASAGLIISEATQISTQGIGYPWTPGIHTPEQIKGWQAVTEKVHGAGGRIFLQLFHCGRISHPDFHGGEAPVAPSPIRPAGQVFTPQGMRDFVVPRELKAEEIPEIIEQFARGAENAMSADFDGVELHCANGYLPDQFLCDGTNHRKDRYGGSIENRSRFVIELVERVIRTIDPARVGIRLSPSGLFNDMFNSQPQETFTYVIEEINRFNLCYLHLMEPQMPVESFPQYLKTVTPHFRKIYRGPLITNCGFDREGGNTVLREGAADLVAYGKLFIANPDLPARFGKKAPLNEWNEATFYGGDEKGYTDYPLMGESSPE